MRVCLPVFQTDRHAQEKKEKSPAPCEHGAREHDATASQPMATTGSSPPKRGTRQFAVDYRATSSSVSILGAHQSLTTASCSCAFPSVVGVFVLKPCAAHEVQDVFNPHLYLVGPQTVLTCRAFIPVG